MLAAEHNTVGYKWSLVFTFIVLYLEQFFSHDHFIELRRID